jgi:hypothetical protein
MKLLILGNARNGKDTFAELLNKHFRMTFKSSSEMAMELFLFERLSEKYGYKTMSECFEDRLNHRQEWYLSICEYNKEDKSRLAKDIISKYDCYVGMRDLEEFNASKELFDVIIWVDASERIGLPESTNKISQKEAHIILTNNSTFDEFEQKSILIGKMILEMDKNPFKTNQMIW